VSEQEGPFPISVEGSEELGKDSHEVVRVWITNNAGSSVWIRAQALEDPRIFGYLMSDTIRHAARAYATTWSIDEDEALQTIVDGLAEELREQFGEITTLQEGSLN
jgi:hypothetical protein